MVVPFIRNHQFNLIKKQTGIIQHASKTVADLKIMEAVRYSAESKVLDMFPHVSEIEKQMLEKISSLNQAEDFQQYIASLTPYLIKFPKVNEIQIKKIFSKNKKLLIPDVDTIDYRYLTYLSWMDIATNKMFLIYNFEGKVVGVEGKFTPTNKKSTCFLCNGYGAVALFSAKSKSRPANSSPDYYKAVGNYLCINNQECNKNITDVTSLERFIENVIR